MEITHDRAAAEAMMMGELTALEPFRVPPSDEVLVAMADIDSLHGKLTDLLVAVGRLQERFDQQDGRTDLFWSKDWPGLLATIQHLDKRVDQIERVVHDAQAQTRVFRWAFGVALTILGLVAAYLAIYH